MGGVTEAQPKRGALRIYLGAAPAVGKTFAMLNEGRRRERGREVVVGIVETHGRQRTAEQIGDLEVIARRVVDRRDTTIEEMESLNDVVEGITGIRQRETVPNHVVPAADQIELVDMSPEALRRRLAAGLPRAPRHHPAVGDTRGVQVIADIGPVTDELLAR